MRCSKQQCCKQCRYVKFKSTMTQWPVHKQTHRTVQKHSRIPRRNELFVYKIDIN